MPKISPRKACVMLPLCLWFLYISLSWEFTWNIEQTVIIPHTFSQLIWRLIVPTNPVNILLNITSVFSPSCLKHPILLQPWFGIKDLHSLVPFFLSSLLPTKLCYIHCIMTHWNFYFLLDIALALYIYMFWHKQRHVSTFYSWKNPLVLQNTS